MPSKLPQLYLFGGSEPWSPLDWTASDDRVRGGSSISHLTYEPSSLIAVFTGNLNIKTLGGAGFASQRTTGEDRSWDLSEYDGLELNIDASDEKQYTLILKDELLPKSPNGREQSTVSWEWDFKGQDAQGADGKTFVAWDDLKPTYRGREKNDVKPLDLKNIKRFSIMMRSFFGTQEGDFSLSIISISAITKDTELYRDVPNGTSVPLNLEGEKLDNNTDSTSAARGWLSWVCGNSAWTRPVQKNNLLE